MMETVVGLDICPQALATFRQNRRQATGICHDIQTLPIADLFARLPYTPQDIDLIVGGPPCQGFSSIRPFPKSQADDPRNSLFEHFVQYVQACRPNVFILENVPGLIGHDKGRTMERIQTCFWQLGYESQYRVLNAVEYGVPQQRKRLIVLGTLPGGPILFPPPTHSLPPRTVHTSPAASPAVPGKPEKTQKTEEQGILWPDPLERYVTVQDALSDLVDVPEELPNGYLCAPQSMYQAVRRRNTRRLTLHEPSQHTDRTHAIIRQAGTSIHALPKDLQVAGFYLSYSRMPAHLPAHTLTTQFLAPSSGPLYTLPRKQGLDLARRGSVAVVMMMILASPAAARP